MTKPSNILIIGKSPAALQEMAALLHAKGYAVTTTNEFNDVPDRFNLGDFDLITMGGRVPPETKAAITKAATARKPSMLFVQGMAAIPGLVVNQIEGELTAANRKPNETPTFDIAARTLTLSLQNPAQVIVTAWWQTTFVPPNPGSNSRILCNETLASGPHTVPIPTDIPEQSSFVSVKIGDALYCLKLEP